MTSPAVTPLVNPSWAERRHRHQHRHGRERQPFPPDNAKSSPRTGSLLDRAGPCSGRPRTLRNLGTRSAPSTAWGRRPQPGSWVAQLLVPVGRAPLAASGRTGSRPARGCRRGGDPVRGRSARRRAPSPRSGGSRRRRGGTRSASAAVRPRRSRRGSRGCRCCRPRTGAAAAASRAPRRSVEDARQRGLRDDREVDVLARVLRGAVELVEKRHARRARALVRAAGAPSRPAAGPGRSSPGSRGNMKL